MRKKAFTLIELIVVVVVLGILAASAIPRFKRDTRVEAINHMLTMIRYTQNLALHDSKHSPTDPKWQRSYWQFAIRHCSNYGLYYQIGSDSNFNGKISNEESAVDPSNGKFTHWLGAKPCPSPSSIDKDVSPNIFITQKYGINNITFRNGCTGKTYIGFDNYGRPAISFGASTKPNYSSYMGTDCKLIFSFEDNSINPFTIIIPKESGYAYLEENPNL